MSFTTVLRHSGVLKVTLDVIEKLGLKHRNGKSPTLNKLESPAPVTTSVFYGMGTLLVSVQNFQVTLSTFDTRDAYTYMMQEC